MLQKDEVNNTVNQFYFVVRRAVLKMRQFEEIDIDLGRNSLKVYGG